MTLTRVIIYVKSFFGIAEAEYRHTYQKEGKMGIVVVRMLRVVILGKV